MLSPAIRRPPALVLVPCLLLMGVLVTRAPEVEAGTESIGGHAQVVRAPVLRVAMTPGAVLPALGLALPVVVAVEESAPSLAPAEPATPTPHSPYLSRAPPVRS